MTRLTTSGTQTARLIVDLGRMAMGTVEVGLRRAGGAPVRVAYAQFRQFLGPDMTAPFGTHAHPFSRFDVFDVVDPAT